MTVVMGADYNATRKLVAAAAKIQGPVYLRFTRDAIPDEIGFASVVVSPLRVEGHLRDRIDDYQGQAIRE